MARYVVVLASGETELRALPHLVSHLQGTTVAVRTPPNGDIVNHAEGCRSRTDDGDGLLWRLRRGTHDDGDKVSSVGGSASGRRMAPAVALG